ncbi:MAG: extracellular solute-binding protein [Cyanobacteria bacterium RI_101]|nr:extracellular solute-binding protein [Cyanobacteria bacterium RI_101]
MDKLAWLRTIYQEGRRRCRLAPKSAALGLLSLAMTGGLLVLGIPKLPSLEDRINYEIEGALPSLVPDSNLRGKILIWHGERIQAFNSIRRLVGAYEDLHPRVKIVLETIPENRLIKTIIENTRGGLAPNLTLTNYASLLDLIEADAVSPITPPPQFENYLPAALSQVTYRGKIYGFPVAVLTQVLCYNRAKLGEKLPAATLDELSLQAGQGYSVGIPSSFLNTFWGLSYFTPHIFDAGGDFAIRRGAWSLWLSWLLRAKTQPNVFLEADESALLQAFRERRLTYLICDASYIAELQQSLGKQEFGIALLPRHLGRQAGPLLYTKVLAVGKTPNAQQEKIALDFAQFAVNPEQVRQRVQELEGFIPPDLKLKLNANLYATEAILMRQSQSAIAIPLEKLGTTLGFSEEAELLYQQVIAGSLSPRQAGETLRNLILQHSQPQPPSP